MTPEAPLPGDLAGDPGAGRWLSAIFAVSSSPDPKNGFLEAVRCRKDHWVRADVRFGAALLQIELKPLSASRDSYAQSRDIAVSCSEQKVGRALGRYLRMIAARLGDRTFSEVSSIAVECRGAVIEPPESPEGPNSDARSSDLTTYFLGGAVGSRHDKWWNFFADLDFSNEESELVWTGRALTVMLGERECYYARPPSDFRRWSFLNYPHMSLPNAGPKAVGPAARRLHRNVMPFELKESDIVMGTQRKEDEIVDALRRKAGQVDVLLTCGSCTTVIMGMDAKALSRRCGAELGCSVIERGQNYREDLPDSVAETFRMFLEGEKVPVSPDPQAVNLYDFPSRYREEELMPFLSELGLQPRLNLLPEVSVGSVRRIPEALWQVSLGTSSRARELPGLFAQRGLRALPVCAPYGIRDSRRCLEAIARETGRLGAFQAAWRRRWSGFLGAWRELRQEALRYRLAFVVREEGRLHDPVLSRGVPFLGMLREMGFGVDVLVYAPRGTAPPPPASLRSDSVRLTAFSSPQELERLLRVGEFRAVFSDIFYDWRLTEAGKAQFSQRNFEMGMAGALRSLRSLLSVCRLPFYERYAPFLTRRPRGGHV